MNFREWDIKIVISSAYVIGSYIIFLVYRRWFDKDDNYYRFGPKDSRDFDTGMAFIFAPVWIWIAIPFVFIRKVGSFINYLTLTSKNK